jgi:hypothetical protein
VPSSQWKTSPLRPTGTSLKTLHGVIDLDEDSDGEVDAGLLSRLQTSVKANDLNTDLLVEGFFRSPASSTVSLLTIH